MIVNDGANQTFTISADAGNQVADVVVDGNSKGAVTTYTFSNVTADHAITASFGVDPTPTGTITLNGGSSQTYSALVPLQSSVTGAVDMCTSTDNVTWTDWRPYVANSVVALPGLPGVKTVWAQYRNASPSTLKRSASVTLAPVAFGAGSQHVLAIKADGSLWAWGSNLYGQLGDGTFGGSRLTPAQVGIDTHWAALAGGNDYTVAIKSDGSLWAWGVNNSGQLGDGTQVDKNVPTRIGSDNDWIAADCGAEFTVALKSNGTLWAWGRNDKNQLGDGTVAYRLSPTLISGAGGWVAFSCGAHFSVAVKSDGSLWGWGDNGFGQFGDGTTGGTHSTPTRIGAGSDWVTAAAGVNGVIALKASGTLYGWGRNNYGQLGLGTLVNTPIPTQIGTGADWAAVKGTGVAPSSLACKSDGSLWAWGSNSDGQLGDGTTTDKSIPTRVGIDVDWAATTGDGSFGLALKSDGTFWAWGDNSQGQLGDGTTTDSWVPKAVTLTGTAPTVTSPNGGESWVIGEAPDITWTPGSGGAVTIELSRDQGASWEPLYGSTPNDGSQSWTASGTVTSQALVRVSNGAGLDTSDAAFTIGLFAAKSDYATGSFPYSVAVGDFNGDGKQDLAAANREGNSVSVLLGSGSGTFAAKVDYATGLRPWRSPSATSTATASRTWRRPTTIGNSVSVLLGNGSGGFAAQVDYATGLRPYSVAVADFNGDGKQDLATANSSGHSVSVLLGSGSGTFAAKVDYATGNGTVLGRRRRLRRRRQAGPCGGQLLGHSVSVLLGSGSGTFAAKIDLRPAPIRIRSPLATSTATASRTWRRPTQRRQRQRPAG